MYLVLQRDSRYPQCNHIERSEKLSACTYQYINKFKSINKYVRVVCGMCVCVYAKIMCITSYVFLLHVVVKFFFFNIALAINFCYTQKKKLVLFFFVSRAINFLLNVTLNICCYHFWSSFILFLLSLSLSITIFSLFSCLKIYCYLSTAKKKKNYMKWNEINFPRNKWQYILNNDTGIAIDIMEIRDDNQKKQEERIAIRQHK